LSVGAGLFLGKGLGGNLKLKVVPEEQASSPKEANTNGALNKL